MAKKLKGIISLIIVVVLIFSFFTLSFSMSVIDGDSRELEKEVNSLPFKPFFTASLTLGSPSKAFDSYSNLMSKPLIYLLCASGEVDTQQVINENSESQLTNEKQPDLSKVKILTSEDAEELEKSPYIKMAFVKSKSSSNEELQFKNILVPISRVPRGFLKNIEMPLEYGNYFTNSSSLNSIILTDHLSKKIFGNTNPVGKIVHGGAIHFGSPKFNKTDYKVIGVLKPLSINEKAAFSMFSGAFAPLPANYRVGKVSPTNKFAFLNAIMNNVLYVVPEKGKDKEALKLLENMMKDRGDGKVVNPVIDSTYKKISAILSINERKEHIRDILYVVIFMIFVSLFTAMSFMILEIMQKKREISIKRAIGESKKMLVKEYFNHYLPLSIISLGISLLILLLMSPYLKNLNVAGKFIPVFASSSSVYAPHPLSIGMLTLSSGIVAAVIISIIAVYVSLNKVVQSTPSEGMKVGVESVNTKINPGKIILVVIIAVSIAGTFFAVSAKTATLKRISYIETELQPDVLRIFPHTSDKASLLELSEGSASYTYSDYIALKKFIGNKGVIGFRSTTPKEMQLIFMNAPDKTARKARVSEATPEFSYLYGLKVEKGRFIEEGDSGKNVCVIGAGIAKSNNATLGESVFLGNKIYKVIGILKSDNPLIDKTIFCPCGSVVYPKTPYSLSQYSGTGMFLIKANNPKDRLSLAESALQFLNKRHSDKDPGSIIDIKEDINNILRISTSLYTLLSIFILLALISAFLSLSALLFIEVIRRTREIGIKKAVGATKKNIIKEFTLNGLKTTIIALTIGIPIGILAALLMEKLKGWNYYIPVNILILVILISLILGFIFSFLPALFASQINPVEAMRSE